MAFSQHPKLLANASALESPATALKFFVLAYILNICRVLVFIVFYLVFGGGGGACSACLFLYGPFCNGALKLDNSILFTTFYGF